MNQRTAGIFLAVILLIALGIVVLWWTQQDRPAAPGQVAAPEAPRLEGDEVLTDLYFPGNGGRLFVEQRVLPVSETLEERLSSLLEAFLLGPEAENLYPAFPPEVSLSHSMVTAEGVAYVDLTIAGQNSNLPWGSREEMLAVYGLVDTVLLNLPEIQGVILLRNGEQRSTFGGHLDTTRLLLANDDLVADRLP
jgi:spore germination protein GerM